MSFFHLYNNEKYKNQLKLIVINMDVDEYGECLHDFTWDVGNLEKRSILDEFVGKIGIPVKCAKCGQKAIAKFVLSHIE